MTVGFPWRRPLSFEFPRTVPGLPPGVAQPSALSLGSAGGRSLLELRFAICKRPKPSALLVAHVASVSATYVQGVSAGDESKRKDGPKAVLLKEIRARRT